MLHVSDVVFQILPGQSSGCTTRADSLRFTGNGNPAVLHLDMYLNTLEHPLGGETKKKKGSSTVLITRCWAKSSAAIQGIDTLQVNNFTRRTSTEGITPATQLLLESNTWVLFFFLKNPNKHRTSPRLSFRLTLPTSPAFTPEPLAAPNVHRESVAPALGSNVSATGRDAGLQHQGPGFGMDLLIRIREPKLAVISSRFLSLEETKPAPGSSFLRDTGTEERESPPRQSPAPLNRDPHRPPPRVGATGSPEKFHTAQLSAYKALKNTNLRNLFFFGGGGEV